ncbi:spore germination protein [Rossellomorea aquimaris]|uniref:GerAB/ArcD/ProY family transporter n=1 Tax=Rossellomorea aquimaris TaxID=189382 RepID=UPI001CD4489D|nr:GerAB/ArcD/ProY family transporter [Rossellomorea aquimaris]MCA1054445.1 spore germination protein [Rossellomorea aquimaris]
MKKTNKLASAQLTFFIIQTQIGVGVLGLPFNVHSVSKQDAWMSVLIAGVAVQVIIILLWLLGKRFPSQSLFQYSSQLFGKMVGSLINGGYLVYGILVVSLILVSAAGIMQSWSLTLTPKWVIMLLLLIPTIYIGKEKVQDISNVFVVVSALIVLLIIISTLVLFIYPVDWRYLFPMGASGGLTILKGAKEAYFSMLGFELILILYPNFKGNGAGSILKAATAANGITTIIYTFLTIVSLVTFSPEELKIVPQPVLYYVKSLYFQVIERIDLLFASLWIVSVITSLTSYLFLCTESCSHWFKGKRFYKRGYCAVILTLISFTIALFPHDEQQVELLSTWVLKVSWLFVLALPVLMLGVSLIFKKEESDGA